MTNNTNEFKDWSEQDISNGFMFYKIFTTYPDMCKRLLEILLGLNIAKIEYPEGERIFNIDAQAHSIRLDIFTQDKNHVYDIEMQTSSESDLPERARYYQGLMDTATLKTSEPYENLKDSILIFICKFDPFKKGKAKYEFRNIEVTDKETELGDRTKKIFFNTLMYDKIQNDDELKGLLEFFNSNKAETRFTSSLENLVNIAKHNSQWRQTYMTIERFQYYATKEGLKRGLEQGLQQGLEKGMQQGLEKGLEKGMEKGMQKQKAIDEKIIAQKDKEMAELRAEIEKLKAQL